MHYVHDLDPVILKMGSLQVRWYGMMYLIGFVVGFLQFRKRFYQGVWKMDPEMSQILITYLMIGMMIGARLIYVLVYNPQHFFENPSEIIAIWQGGLSFHGAALGFIVGMLLFSKKYGVGFYHVTDSVVLGASTGIFFGRIGNFINGELYGRFTDAAIGVVFPQECFGKLACTPMPRHPSQLYQAVGEGLCVFAILKIIEWNERKKGYAPSPLLKPPAEAEGDSKKKKKKNEVVWKRTGILGCSFLILYGVARFIVEFFRQPDEQLGFFAGFFTMGQILCFIMIFAGAFLLRKRIQQPISESYEPLNFSFK